MHAPRPLRRGLPVLTFRMFMLVGASGSLVGILGCSSSGNALSEVLKPASPISNPVSQTVVDGASATFSVVATGTPATYQWSRDGKEIAGANGPTYQTPATIWAQDNNTKFTCTMTGDGGPYTTQAAVLTVTPLPTTFLADLSDQTATEGDTPVLSVTAQGTLPFSYQWMRNGVAIAGATQSSYALPALVKATEDGASYTVKVTNGPGLGTLSHAAVLTVASRSVSPLITKQPISMTPTAPDGATFEVKAAGSALRYQWQKGGRDIDGATGSTFSTGATSFSEPDATYTVKVWDGNSYPSVSDAATCRVMAPNATYPGAGDPQAAASRQVSGRPSYHLDPHYPNGSFRFAYEEKYKNPLWTAYADFNAPTEFKAVGDRTFRPDDRSANALAAPLVTTNDMGSHNGKFFHANNDGYGFDRGHMVPYAELAARYLFNTFSDGQDNADDSCRMSNVIPQVSYFNQRLWQKLESAAGALVDGASPRFPRVWIYTGPIFADVAKVTDPVNYWAPGTETYSTTPVNPSSATNIAVPEACFKIMVVEPAAGKTLPRVLAWVSSNRLYSTTETNNDLWKYVTSVARIEALTGLDFFPGLPHDANLTALKSTVDVTPWGAPFEPASGPNAHIIQPSWDVVEEPKDDVIIPTLKAGDSLTFVGQAYPHSGSGASVDPATGCVWTFGDTGTTASGLSVDHTFATEGLFQVSFAVTDSSHATTTVTRQIQVGGATTGNKPPTLTPGTLPAVRVATVPAGLSASQAFTVSDDSTDPANIVLTVTSDNPSVLPGTQIQIAAGLPNTRTLTMIPAGAGTAKVTVQATDKEGAATQASFDFTAYVPSTGGAPSVIISQYYEGASNNKWIEITNTGSGDLDFGSTPMSLWCWANPYSTAGGTYNAMSLTGTLPVGASMVFKNNQAAAPDAAHISGTAAASAACNFNGDDVVFLSPTSAVTSSGAITNGAAAFAARIDVIGENNSATWTGATGNTGAIGNATATFPKMLGQDRSYVRKPSVTTGSPDFHASDWILVDSFQITGTAPSAVESAAADSTNRLGFHVYNH